MLQTSFIFAFPPPRSFCWIKEDSISCNYWSIQFKKSVFSRQIKSCSRRDCCKNVNITTEFLFWKKKYGVNGNETRQKLLNSSLCLSFEFRHWSAIQRRQKGTLFSDRFFFWKIRLLYFFFLSISGIRICTVYLDIFCMYVNKCCFDAIAHTR